MHTNNDGMAWQPMATASGPCGSIGSGNSFSTAVHRTTTTTTTTKAKTPAYITFDIIISFGFEALAS